jgi:hypothetical protein
MARWSSIANSCSAYENKNYRKQESKTSTINCFQICPHMTSVYFRLSIIHARPKLRDARFLVNPARHSQTESLDFGIAAVQYFVRVTRENERESHATCLEIS